MIRWFMMRVCGVTPVKVLGYRIKREGNCIEQVSIISSVRSWATDNDRKLAQLLVVEYIKNYVYRGRRVRPFEVTTVEESA